MVRVWIRLPASVVKRIDKLASALRRSRVSIMEQAVEEYAPALDKEKK